MNMVPADVMCDMGAKTVIAVDVSSEEKTDFYEYGEFRVSWSDEAHAEGLSSVEQNPVCTPQLNISSDYSHVR